MNRKTIFRVFDIINLIIGPIEKFTAVVCFIGMCIVVMYGIICRFILKIPNLYGEEVSRYLMILAVYVAVAVGVRRKEHIRVDAFINLLPSSARRFVDALGVSITAVGYGFLSYLSYDMVSRLMRTRQLTPCMRIPMYLPYLALVVGLALACIHQIEMLLRDIFDLSVGEKGE